jgi:hypothetical protein
MADDSVFWWTLDQLFMLLLAKGDFDSIQPALLRCQVQLQLPSPFCKTTPGASPWTSQWARPTCIGMSLELVDLRGWVRMPLEPSIAYEDMRRDITPQYDHQRCGFWPARLFLLADLIA